MCSRSKNTIRGRLQTQICTLNVIVTLTGEGGVVRMMLNIEKEGSTSLYDTLEYSFMTLRGGGGVGVGLAVMSLCV